jgi:hypothetical protein
MRVKKRAPRRSMPSPHQFPGSANMCDVIVPHVTASRRCIGAKVTWHAGELACG